MLENKKIIIFNGPPGSGKDTLAAGLQRFFLTDNLQPKIVRFAEPIKHSVSQLFYNGSRDFDLRENKDVPCGKLYGATPREAQIAYSENFCKPLFGNDYFGKVFIENIKKEIYYNIFLVPDGGFLSELEHIVKCIPQQNILIVKLFRNNCDFSNDSRRYIPLEDFPNINCITVENNSTIEEAIKSTYEKVKQYVN